MSRHVRSVSIDTVRFDQRTGWSFRYVGCSQSFGSRQKTVIKSSKYVSLKIIIIIIICITLGLFSKKDIS